MDMLFSFSKNCFNFLSQYPHMVNYQHYPLNPSHDHILNNLILNTKIKIGIRFHFGFITHHIVQSKVKLFSEIIINFHLFLLHIYVEPWYLILFMKLILVWLVLIHQVTLYSSLFNWNCNSEIEWDNWMILFLSEVAIVPLIN